MASARYPPVGRERLPSQRGPDQTPVVPALTLDQLREFARDKLAGYKIPLRLKFVDALPRNPAGKVLEYQLAAQLTASPQG